MKAKQNLYSIAVRSNSSSNEHTFSVTAKTIAGAVKRGKYVGNKMYYKKDYSVIRVAKLGSIY